MSLEVSGDVVDSPLKVQRSTSWPGMQFLLTTENIRDPTLWAFKRDQHTLIVHIDGAIHQLETELDGCGTYPDPPMNGEAWIIPAGHPLFNHAQGETVHYAELLIEVNPANRLPGSLDLPRIKPCISQFDEFIHAAARRLAVLTSRADDVAQMDAQALGQALGQHLYQEYSASGEALSARRSNHLLTLTVSEKKALQEHIESGLGGILRLDELAALLGMTTYELLPAFRRAFGNTPAQYVIDQRIRRVRWLLWHSRADLATIAMDCGFSSHSHLTTAFKQHVGLTPSEFRVARRY
jgi:AraC family transcriptional regulator